MMARAVTDLPQPLSPTTASVLPAATAEGDAVHRPQRPAVGGEGHREVADLEHHPAVRPRQRRLDHRPVEDAGMVAPGEEAAEADVALAPRRRAGGAARPAGPGGRRRGCRGRGRGRGWRPAARRIACRACRRRRPRRPRARPAGARPWAARPRPARHRAWPRPPAARPACCRRPRHPARPHGRTSRRRRRRYAGRSLRRPRAGAAGGGPARHRRRAARRAAASGASPARSRSRPRRPSIGLTRAWVATAPTLALDPGADRAHGEEAGGDRDAEFAGRGVTREDRPCHAAVLPCRRRGARPLAGQRGRGW